MIPKPDPKLSRHAKGDQSNDFLRDSFGKPDPMPDDRPESPEERITDAIDAVLAEVGHDHGTNSPWTLTFARRVARRALSTPAGPSPSGDRLYDMAVWARSLPHLPDRERFAAEWATIAAAEPAPSPREEAVEALDRDALIEMVTSAISQAATNRPKKEGTRQRFRRYATAAVDALSAAHPFSPTPEQSPHA